MKLGSVTADQMAEVDRQILQELGLDLPMMMENASFVIAEQARRMTKNITNTPVVALVGSGHNGANAAAACRRLASWGAKPMILLAQDRQRLKPMTEQQLTLAEQYGVKTFDTGALMPPAEIILDGLVGYNLSGSLRDTYSELVEMALRVKVPILAIDVPSGLDATTGKASHPAIRADVTVTLAYPKTGLLKPFAKNMVGQLLVGDIGIPPITWQQFSQPAPDFSSGPLVEVDR